MIKATGLWVNNTKSGDKYFSGVLGGVRVVILKNTFKKEGEKTPDWNMYFDENKPKDATKTEVEPEEDIF